MIDPRRILQAAKAILLVDWPNTSLPRALLAAGFDVFGFSPGRYSRAEVVAERPADATGMSIFAPEREGESGYLVFHWLEHRPARVDIVHVYRPPEELPGILANHVIPLGAKALWLQPPIRSAEARQLAANVGLSCVEG